MRNTVKLTLAGLALLAGGMQSAHAVWNQAQVISKNTSANSVWITYYNTTKNHLATACVTAGATQTQNFNSNDVIKSLGGLYLRFEYKQNRDCGGKTLYDSHYGGMYQMPGLGKTITVNIPGR